MSNVSFNIPTRKTLTQATVSNQGGPVFEARNWDKLRRFLIVGTESGTSYANEKTATKMNCESAQECLKEDPMRFVSEIVDVSHRKLARKNDYAVYCLALAVAYENTDVRQYALTQLPLVCRTGTHLFQFVDLVVKLRGKLARSIRTAIAHWYNDHNNLPLQLLKYNNRHGFTHKDVIRLAHPKISEEHQSDIAWVMRDGGFDGEMSPLLKNFENIKAMRERNFDVKEIANLVEYARLPREAIERADTSLLNEPDIWNALIPSMPVGALVRNLGKISSMGVADMLSDNERIIKGKLLNIDEVKKSGIHPVSILIAAKVYAAGKGVKGNLTWTPNGNILEALDRAFYFAMESATPSNKRILVALDISGSMGWSYVDGVPGLTARDASAAMALATVATEPNCGVVGFHHSLMPLQIRPTQSLGDVIRYVSNLGFGGTDIALPMNFAREKKMAVDAFVVYTDNEHGFSESPAVALEKYRRATGIKAKLITVAATAGQYSIADPKDPLMLDISGFSADTPQLISNFIRS